MQPVEIDGKGELESRRSSAQDAESCQEKSADEMLTVSKSATF
jgi:hypothetical protein